MSKVYRTANGRSIDIGALKLKNDMYVRLAI